MPSASMNRLMDNIRIRTPGALDGVIQSEVFAAVTDLCRDANIWTMPFEIEREVATLDVWQDPDAYTYQIIPPAGSRTVRLMFVGDGNRSRVPAVMLRPNYITFNRSPNEPDIVTAWVTLTVTDPITRSGEPVAPDWIVEEFNDTIMNGAVARMMSQVAKPYSNPQLAVTHYNLFRRGLAQARTASDRGRTYGGQTWRYPQNFAVHRR